MIEIGCSGLHAYDAVAVARRGERVRLSGAAREAMLRSRARVEMLAMAEEPVYGIFNLKLSR